MPATTSTFAANLTYTPPGGNPNSGTAVLTVSASGVPLSVGKLDIPAATGAATVFAIPFGTVGAGAGGNAKGCIVRNTVNDQDIFLRLNGSANLYRIPPGGMVAIANPVAPGALPLTSADIVTTALQVTAAEVDYYVYGD